MNDPLAVAAAAAGAFAGTNVDDVIVLALLFMAGRSAGRPRAWQIWAGQYAGFGVLVALSALAALGLTIVPDRWVGLLGLIPLALGVRGLVQAVRDGGDADGVPRPIAAGTLSIAAVTIANGADNVAVYTPMLRSLGTAEAVLTIAVFFVLLAVWCVVGARLGAHRRAVATIGRWGHWIVPLVFVAIGTAIVVESGVIGRIV